jgi:4-hydroxybenzoate polyprenyltransferase
MIAPVFTSLRPKQWVKNLILFAALFFSEKGLLFSGEAWARSLIGFVTFCGLSGSVYLLNDIVDIDKDRQHPEKSGRPIASGILSIAEAKAALIIILLICLGVAWNISGLFFAMALSYFMLNLSYSFKLKNVVIIDVMCIAMGFVLRATAGVGALRALDPEIHISHWLLLATLMLAMFLGLAKRRQEIAHYAEGGTRHRSILAHYSPAYIDQMTSILAGTTIVTYTSYTVSSETISKFGSDKLIYTVPMVVYGILRYLYLIHIQEMGENPSDIALHDRPLQFNMIIWLTAVVLIIHGQSIQKLLAI